MRQMFDELKVVKNAIDDSAEVIQIPDHAAIHTAKPTKKNLRNEEFNAFSDSYLATLEKLRNATDENRAALFNKTVKSCVTCHKTYCQGPIVKIKKLKLSYNEQN